MTELCIKTNEEAISTVCNDVAGVRYCKLTIQREEVCVPVPTSFGEAFQRLQHILKGLGIKDKPISYDDGDGLNLDYAD